MEPAGQVEKYDAEWRRVLTPEQYRVLRQAGTERPFGTAYAEFNAQGAGVYVCAGCGAELFSSREKFDSHCGWPSFYDPANAKNVVIREDRSHGGRRTEVLCAGCGHPFDLKLGRLRLRPISWRARPSLRNKAMACAGDKPGSSANGALGKVVARMQITDEVFHDEATHRVTNLRTQLRAMRPAWFPAP